jgi:hypothetical protein
MSALAISHGSTSSAATPSSAATSDASVAQRVEELLLERLHPVKDEVFLGREVVEHRRLGDLRLPGDLRHRDRVEAPLGEQPPSRVGDLLPRALLLKFARSECGRHRVGALQ